MAPSSAIAHIAESANINANKCRLWLYHINLLYKI